MMREPFTQTKPRPERVVEWAPGMKNVIVKASVGMKNETVKAPLG